MSDRVIVAGAGPVGAAAAVALGLRGVSVLLVEQETDLPADPRAATLQPPTLEMLDDLGVGGAIHARGLAAPRFQFRDRASDDVIAVFDYGRLAGETPHPFAVQCEQFKVASALVERARALPNVEVRLGTRLEGFDQDEEGVIARIAGPGGAETVGAAFLIGCDGGRSGVRKTLGVAFEGFTYPERFLVLTTRFDFATLGYEVRNYCLDPERWCALFKVPHEGPPGLWRCVFPTPGDAPDEAVLSDEAVDATIRTLKAPLTAADVVHRNLYKVNQRVAASFAEGRVLLAGDAAHVNNPLGGLGMNSGIHDALNAADKIAAALAEPARRTALLGAYDAERRALAEEYVQAQTIQNKKRLEAKDDEARARNMEELRASAADPDRHRAWVMRASLIEGLRKREAA